MTEVRFGQAINRALADAMAQDSSVVLLGEDIGGPGGPFGVTRGLLNRFGQERVRDTPISEAAIVGAAVGAAMTGLRPVVEIMFMDFVTLAMDALVNQAAKARFMFGGQVSVPMVVRMPHGGGINAGPQHSQCLEAWLAHIPGLKVVCPSNVEDAYALLRAAIDDDDPVIVVENKALYATKGELPESISPVQIGRARTARSGRDVTIVSYGAMVPVSLAAAARLEKEGLDAEVLDMRSLQPWDEAAVLGSLSRTHRLVVCHEAVEAFGIGAEIVARLADAGFDELDGPLVRVGAPFMPPPFAKSLEEWYRPDARRIISAVKRAMA
jgi:acetoin:2,6-dichlorophenolindophenol oxidoreductase subunit beta